MALGALRAFHEAGREVPGDVGVVGYDDIPEAAHLLPPLTTVRTDFAEIGRRALRLRLSRIEEPDRPRAGHVVPVALVVRGSTM
ncbi:substrate-binding domain-containing protein [Streptomyces sp. NPDC003006]